MSPFLTYTAPFPHPSLSVPGSSSLSGGLPLPLRMLRTHHRSLCWVFQATCALPFHSAMHPSVQFTPLPAHSLMQPAWPPCPAPQFLRLWPSLYTEPFCPTLDLALGSTEVFCFLGSPQQALTSSWSLLKLLEPSSPHVSLSHCLAVFVP